MVAGAKIREPVFGRDYDLGWAGFTYYPENILSMAIAYGEHWERAQDEEGWKNHIHPDHARAQLVWQQHAKIHAVSHAFICTGDGTGIEAHMETGVARFNISKYSTDENCQLYFRKPMFWTPTMGKGLVDIAAKSPPLGCPYDMDLIYAMAFNYSITGHLLNLATLGRFKNWSCRRASQPNHFICSMTVASIYRRWWGMGEPSKLPGCLKQDPCTVDPQQLFDDDEVFAPPPATWPQSPLLSK